VLTYYLNIGKIMNNYCISMSKDMSGKEKLLFIVSFIWAMHWGVRVAFAAISTFELRYF